MRGAKMGRRPHVFVILSLLLLAASALTWVVPAGHFARVFDPAAGQTLVVPGSYAPAAPSPVALWQLPLLLFDALTTGSAPRLIFFVLLLGGSFEIILESGAVTGLCTWTEAPALSRRQMAVLALFFGTLAVVAWGVGARGWSVPELAAVFLVLGLACGAAAGFGANQICLLLTAGCKKMVGGALTIGLAAALRLVLERGGILDSIVLGLLRLVEGLPGWSQLLGMFYANVLLDLLITSGSGHAAVAMPLMVPLADGLALSRRSAVLAFQLWDGLANLVSPISNTLVSCLALSGVSYPGWLRYFLPLVGVYLAVGTGFMVLAGWVGY